VSDTKRANAVRVILLLILAATALLSMRYGAINISPEDIFSSFKGYAAGSKNIGLNQRIFMDIRLPRVILCILTGASLAVGGSLLQALFRNPIVEPGLIGTSSGAAFGAALYFVLGATFKIEAGEWTLPVAACGGAMLSSSLVFLLARSGRTGKSSVVTLLLTGIAINALFMSGVGFLSYIARDPQARSVTFWGLGTLSGANWHSVIILGITALVCITLSLRLANALNTLALGEEEAQYLGVNIRKLKFQVLILNIVLVAVSTAFTGVISFVGLIAPHFARIMLGSDNRTLLPDSALLGAIMLSIADLTARMLLRPAELPIGIVTAIVGVPVFIILLRGKNYFF